MLAIFKTLVGAVLSKVAPGTPAAIEAAESVVRLGKVVRGLLDNENDQASLDATLDKALADMNAAVDRAVKASRG
jgi:hypothetical protein